MSTFISSDPLTHILIALKKGQISNLKLAHGVAVSQPSAWHLLKRFKDDTADSEIHGDGQPAMLSDKDLWPIKCMVDRCPELTAQELSKKKRSGEKADLVQLLVGRPEASQL